MKKTKTSGVPTPLSASKRKWEDHLSITDITVFECPICFDPLTVPVFQCANGHISCHLCHEHLTSKCPTCSKELGNQRNRAMESVIESIKVSCSYNIHGCPDRIFYCHKLSHEDKCVYAPYKCPFTADCAFSGPPTNLYNHLKKKHTRAVVQLKLGHSCKVDNALCKADELVVYLEKGGAAIFILDKKTMRLNCIQDHSKANGKGFIYSLGANLACASFKCSISVESPTFPLPRRRTSANINVSKEKEKELKDSLHGLGYLLGRDDSIILWLSVREE